jgi:hypothetical protein
MFRDATRSRHKITYLRGIPDEIVVQGGKFRIGGCPGFEAAYNNWQMLMTTSPLNPWGWKGRPPGAPQKKNLLSYVVDAATEQINLTFDGPLFPALDITKKVTVFLSGINAPNKSALNGSQIVIVKTQATATTVKPLSVFPFQAGGHGIYEPPAFVGISFGQPLRIGERKAGRAFFVERGRRPVRARG